MAMEKIGLFDSWWIEDSLLKEAKKFNKNPSDTAISTLKQEFYAVDNSEVYTVFFHLRCLAKHYYKSIVKNKMSYLANNSKLIYLKIEKDIPDKEEPIIIFEQGDDSPIGDRFAKTHKLEIDHA